MREDSLNTLSFTKGKKSEYNTEEDEKKESEEERQTETENIEMEQELGK